MARTVVTRKDVEREAFAVREHAKGAAAAGSVAGVAAAPVVGPDTYKDRLLKYIPAEVVAIYLALLSVIKATESGARLITVEWVVFIAVLAVTIPWQRKIVGISKWPQVAIGTVAFVFWAISIGDPFATSWSAWYRPVYGTMAMMFYTFLIPLFEAEQA